MNVILTDGENEVEINLPSEDEETVNVLLGWLPPTVTFMRKEQGRYQTKARKRRKHAAAKPRLGSVPMEMPEKKEIEKKHAVSKSKKDDAKTDVTPIES